METELKSWMAEYMDGTYDNVPSKYRDILGGLLRETIEGKIKDAIEATLTSPKDAEPVGWICTADRGGFLCMEPNIFTDDDLSDCKECCTPFVKEEMEVFYLRPPTVEPTESQGEAVEKRWRFRPFSMMAEEPLPWRYTTYDPRTVPCSAEPGGVEVLEWRPPEPKPDMVERDRPEVVCLCGSTRFADQHAIRRWELEQEGVIVLMINYLPHWWAEEQGWDGNDHFGERTGMKEMLDEMHFRKIDLSNRVEIVNPGGYVGESTVNEIRYALRTGKPVTYMVDELTGPGVAILSAQEGEG